MSQFHKDTTSPIVKAPNTSQVTDDTARPGQSEPESAGDKKDQPSGGSTTNQPSSTPSHHGSSNPNESTSDDSVAVYSSLLSVPVSGTVLTLSGLNYNLYNDMPQKFQGIFSKPPYGMLKVNYPASLASDSITKGVAALNAALQTTPGQKIVLAQSQGAQVASRWMREHTNDPAAPSASELTFILTGNPLRSTGGYLIGRTEVGGTTGQPTPTNTKWPIIDVARRYDGWPDWPQNQSNQWAVDNANEGKQTLHTTYDQINLYSTTHTIWKSGNTTYVLTQEEYLPLWKDNSTYPLSVRTAMRAYIESAYSRAANDPRVVLLPIEPEWQDTLNGWGVPF